MFYGVHEGKKMKDVPKDYLLWLLENNRARPAVKKYIEQNIEKNKIIMASYTVIEPSIDKLTELAKLSFNLRYYEKQFAEFCHPEDEKLAIKYRMAIDKWHNTWLKKNN